MNIENRRIAFRKTEGGLQIPVAIGLLFLLWVGYTVLQSLFLVLQYDRAQVSILEFIPGILGVGILLKAGFSKADCYLRLAWPSWKGLFMLAAFSLVWPFVLSSGRWTGWDWQAALVQGAGGISQELFFRAALLPALLVLFKNRPLPALLLHVVLFAIWHAGAFLITPAELIAGPIAIVSLSLVAGLVWGWQTIHDRTILWAMIHHSLLWVVGSMFYLGPPG